MDEMIKITDENFEETVLKAELPVLVDFYADWCGPCKMQSPIIKEIANEYAGKVIVGKINVDDNPSVTVKYRAVSIPTLILFKNGEVVKQEVGYHTKKEVENMIE